MYFSLLSWSSRTVFAIGQSANRSFINKQENKDTLQKSLPWFLPGPNKLYQKIKCFLRQRFSQHPENGIFVCRFRYLGVIMQSKRGGLVGIAMNLLSESWWLQHVLCSCIVSLHKRHCYTAGSILLLWKRHCYTPAIQLYFITSSLR